MTRLLLTAAALVALAGAPAIAAAPVDGASGTTAGKSDQSSGATMSPRSEDDSARATNCTGDSANAGGVKAEGKMNCEPKASSGSSTNHLDTTSGGSPASKPQGETPPGMQAPVPGAQQGNTPSR